MQAAAAVSRRSSRVPPAPSRLDGARRSRKRSRAVPEPSTANFVFAGWLGGRPRIARESRADGSPAHGRAFRICGRSRAPDRRGEKLAKTLSDWQQCQRGAAVVVGWLRDSTNRAQAPRRRTARAPGALAGLAHVPPWLPPYARRSGRRHRRGESRPEPHIMLRRACYCYCVVLAGKCMLALLKKSMFIVRVDVLFLL